jgi:hypothetical protein
MRRTLTPLMAVLLLVALVVPASAATLGQFYAIPSYAGTLASATVDSLDVVTVGEGRAAGRIRIQNVSGRRPTYVQYKPDPRGPGGWNRGTANHRRGEPNTEYAWSDNFFLYTTGFLFRICEVRRGPDKCGTAVLVEPGTPRGGR